MLRNGDENYIQWNFRNLTTIPATQAIKVAPVYKVID